MFIMTASDEVYIGRHAIANDFRSTLSAVRLSFPSFDIAMRYTQSSSIIRMVKKSKFSLRLPNEYFGRPE